MEACSGQQGTTVESEYWPVSEGGGCQPAVQGCHRAEDGVCGAGEHHRGSVPERVCVRDLDGHAEAAGTPLHVTM